MPSDPWTIRVRFPIDGDDQAEAIEAFHDWIEEFGIEHYAIETATPRQTPDDSFGGRLAPPPPPYPPE